MLTLWCKRWYDGPVDFSSGFCAVGARGFFGEGYWYQPLMRSPLKKLAFVAKTTTLEPRMGNLPLRTNGITPKELAPKCIIVKLHSGHTLNAVGLSGPGAKALLEAGRWQARTRPFMISFMAVSATKSERLEEMRQFERLLYRHLFHFKAPVALQIDFACPTMGRPPPELYGEITDTLEIAANLHIPLVPNFNPLVPIPVLTATASHPACSALWIANTIPWGDPRIDWQAIFGATESPLAKRGLSVPGGGGLSGPACLPHTINRVIEAHSSGIQLPIVAGNGIQHPRDVYRVRKAGADAVAIGTGPLVRPLSAKATTLVALAD